MHAKWRFISNMIYSACTKCILSLDHIGYKSPLCMHLQTLWITYFSFRQFFPSLQIRDSSTTCGRPSWQAKCRGVLPSVSLQETHDKFFSTKIFRILQRGMYTYEKIHISKINSKPFLFYRHYIVWPVFKNSAKFLLQKHSTHGLYSFQISAVLSCL